MQEVFAQIWAEFSALYSQCGGAALGQLRYGSGAEEASVFGPVGRAHEYNGNRAWFCGVVGVRQDGSMWEDVELCWCDDVYTASHIRTIAACWEQAVKNVEARRK